MNNQGIPRADGGLTMRIREGAHRDWRHFDRAKMVTNSTSLCSPCAAQDAPVSGCLQCLADRCHLPQAYRQSASESLHVLKGMEEHARLHTSSCRRLRARSMVALSKPLSRSFAVSSLRECGRYARLPAAEALQASNSFSCGALLRKPSRSLRK